MLIIIEVIDMKSMVNVFRWNENRNTSCVEKREYDSSRKTTLEDIEKRRRMRDKKNVQKSFVVTYN